MKSYVITYYGEPNCKNAEEGAEYMAKWKVWMKGLGAALVNPGVPTGRSKSVSSRGVSDGVKQNRLTGFSILKAESMDAAIEMVKGCPHLEHGTVDIAEAMEMGM